jgi:hypothetical protein
MLPNVAVVSGWCNKISMSVSVRVNSVSVSVRLMSVITIDLVITMSVITHDFDRLSQIIKVLSHRCSWVTVMVTQAEIMTLHCDFIVYHNDVPDVRRKSAPGVSCTFSGHLNKFTVTV